MEPAHLIRITLSALEPSESHRIFEGVEAESSATCRLSQKVAMVPRAGVEPARPFGQRILSPVIGPLPNLTKRYKPVFTRLAVVKVSLRLASYQHVPPPS